MATEIGPGSLDPDNPTPISLGEKSTTAWDTQTSNGPWYTFTPQKFGGLKVDVLGSEADTTTLRIVPCDIEYLDNDVRDGVFPVWPGIEYELHVSELWVDGPVTTVIELGEMLYELEEPYPEGDFHVVEASEDWEGFDVGPLESPSGGDLVMPGWTITGGGLWKTGTKSPLSIDGLDPAALHVTDYRAHTGVRSLRHSNWASWDLEGIDVNVPFGARWEPHGSFPILEASCWHYRNSAYVGLPDWHINLNGRGGLAGLIDPGALDWYWTVNGNVGAGLVEDRGSFLNESEFALENAHFFLERVVNTPGSELNIYEDTGVYAWDRWLKFSCAFDFYTGWFRWEIRDENEVLWTKLIPKLDLRDDATETTSVSARFELDYLNDATVPLPEAMYPDWIDEIHGKVSRWQPTFLPPPELSYGQINLVQYRYTPVSVNVGYEYGSVETFDYARASASWTERLTDAGVPTPANDPRRP